MLRDEKRMVRIKYGAIKGLAPFLDMLLSLVGGETSSKNRFPTYISPDPILWASLLILPRNREGNVILSY